MKLEQVYFYQQNVKPLIKKRYFLTPSIKEYKFFDCLAKNMFIDFLSYSKIFFMIDSLFLLLKQRVFFHPCQTQFCFWKIETQRKNQLFSTMENLLKIAEESSSAAVDIDPDRLKFFRRKVKIWDSDSLSLNKYQELSVEDRFSIL